MYTCRCLRRPEEGARSHRSGVPGGLSHRTWVLGPESALPVRAAITPNCRASCWVFVWELTWQALPNHPLMSFYSWLFTVESEQDPHVAADCQVSYGLSTPPPPLFPQPCCWSWTVQGHVLPPQREETRMDDQVPQTQNLQMPNGLESPLPSLGSFSSTECGMRITDASNPFKAKKGTKVFLKRRCMQESNSKSELPEA